MHTANDFTVTPPATNPVAQRDATLAVLADIKQRLDRADETLTRLESAAAPASTRVTVLRPGFEGPPARYGVPASQSEHEVAGRAAEALGVAGLTVTVWQSADAPLVVRVDHVWARALGPTMTPREVAMWLTVHPDAGEVIEAALSDRGADLAEQAHERAMGGR